MRLIEIIKYEIINTLNEMSMQTKIYYLSKNNEIKSITYYAFGKHIISYMKANVPDIQKVFEPKPNMKIINAFLDILLKDVKEELPGDDNYYHDTPVKDDSKNKSKTVKSTPEDELYGKRFATNDNKENIKMKMRPYLINSWKKLLKDIEDSNN